MTEDRDPQEHEFRGWHLGPFVGGRSYPVTREMRRHRRSVGRWAWTTAFVLVAVNYPPLLGVLIALFVAGIVLVTLSHWRNR